MTLSIVAANDFRLLSPPDTRGAVPENAGPLQTTRSPIVGRLT
jgi:hypothetical protein